MTSATLDARLALSLASSLLSGRYGVPLLRGPRIHLQRHRDSPDPTDLSGVRKWVRSVPKPTAVDLFCGAGGLTQGLNHAGFTVLVGADSDPLAVEPYAANHVGLSYLGDLTERSGILEQLGAWGVHSLVVVAGVLAL